MEIRIYNHPNQKIKNQLFDLVRTCQAIDGTYRLPYLDNTYNFDADMPAFLLADLDNQTVGVLAVYADEAGEAEVSVYVLPDYRRQGIARALLQEFARIAAKYDLSQIEYISESKFLADHPTFAEKFDYDLQESEIWLEQAARSFVQEEKENVEVLLASQEMVEEVANFQSEVFDLPVDTALRYAKESVVSQDSLFYVLRKDGKIVASCTVDTTFESNHIFGLAVMNDYQGQGLGSHLIKSVITNLTRLNGQKFQIVVEKENTGALKLYQKLGFKAVTETVYMVIKK